MNFYDRYAAVCAQRGLDPCSQKAADLFHVTRATISTWGKRANAPKGETVAIIADELNVSADYLLGRTDEQTDYVQSQGAIATRTTTAPKRDPLLDAIARLDDTDRIRVEAYIDGLLTHDKYKKPSQNLA